ncbi:MAG: hypothetical protein AAGN82_31425 [Myxococcota bacterium]
MSSGDDLLSDAFVAAEVEDAMRVVAPALAPDDQQWLRSELARLLVEDPRLAEALVGAHPRSVAHSGMVARRYPTGVTRDGVTRDGVTRDGATGDGATGDGASEDAHDDDALTREVAVVDPPYDPARAAEG